MVKLLFNTQEYNLVEVGIDTDMKNIFGVNLNVLSMHFGWKVERYFLLIRFLAHSVHHTGWGEII